MPTYLRPSPSFDIALCLPRNDQCQDPILTPLASSLLPSVLHDWKWPAQVLRRVFPSAPSFLCNLVRYGPLVCTVLVSLTLLLDRIRDDQVLLFREDHLTLVYAMSSPSRRTPTTSLRSSAFLGKLQNKNKSLVAMVGKVGFGTLATRGLRTRVVMIGTLIGMYITFTFFVEPVCDG